MTEESKMDKMTEEIRENCERWPMTETTLQMIERWLNEGATISKATEKCIVNEEGTDGLLVVWPEGSDGTFIKIDTGGGKANGA